MFIWNGTTSSTFHEGLLSILCHEQHWRHSDVIVLPNFSNRMLGYCVPLSRPRPIRAHYFPFRRTQASCHPNSTVNIRYSWYSVVRLLGCIFINPPHHGAAVQLFVSPEGKGTYILRAVNLTPKTRQTAKTSPWRELCQYKEKLIPRFPFITSHIMLPLFTNSRNVSLEQAVVWYHSYLCER